MYAALARLIKSGVRPTDLNARTGEFTPPGIMV